MRIVLNIQSFDSFYFVNLQCFANFAPELLLSLTKKQYCFPYLRKHFPAYRACLIFRRKNAIRLVKNLYKTVVNFGAK